MSQGELNALAGAWVFVCGPSGSGKDSVMQWAQHALKDRPDIVFSRRNVTRPAQPGSDHDPMTAEEFSTQRQTAALRWHWEAHGFGYGISSRYADEVVRGKIVVVNGSRAHLMDVMESVSATELRVVQVVAAPAALAQRIATRGRDSQSSMLHRLERNALFKGMPNDLLIVNDGQLAHAGHRLVNYLTNLASDVLSRQRCSLQLQR